MVVLPNVEVTGTLWQGAARCTIPNSTVRRLAATCPEVFRFLCARRVRDFELSFLSSGFAGVAGGSAPCIFQRQLTPPAG